MSRLHFDGATYDPALDGERLTTQLTRVRAAMNDGRWHTLAELALVSRGSEASVSARLRDLRKARHGSHEVARERAGHGLWRYRLVPREKQQEWAW